MIKQFGELNDLTAMVDVCPLLQSLGSLYHSFGDIICINRSQITDYTT